MEKLYYSVELYNSSNLDQVIVRRGGGLGRISPGGDSHIKMTVELLVPFTGVKICRLVLVRVLKSKVSTVRIIAVPSLV